MLEDAEHLIRPPSYITDSSRDGASFTASGGTHTTGTDGSAGSAAAAGPAEIMTGNTAVIVVRRPVIPSRASGEGLCGSLLRAAFSHMRCAITESPPGLGAIRP